MNYYNEHDPRAAEWLRELIRAGHIPQGIVDERSITEVKPNELTAYIQCHFFAGIGGWPYALALAGWPVDRPVWTGSCPCQPFSNAGRGLGISDERHLWPVFAELIRACHPPTIFGEQVASKAGREWLAGVFADLEGMGYQRAGADLCAAGVGAPHIRQRLYWVAGRNFVGQWRRVSFSIDCRKDGTVCSICGGEYTDCKCPGPTQDGYEYREHGGVLYARRVANPDGEQCHEGLQPVPGGSPERIGRDRIADRWVENSESMRLQGGERQVVADEREGGQHTAPSRSGRSSWSNSVWWPCRDGKKRRIEPSSFPLANGVPGRVGLLRGYGNAIVPQVAQAFIEAWLECDRNFPGLPAGPQPVSVGTGC